MRTRGFGAVLAAGLLLAACGGGSGKAATTQPSTTTKPPVAASSPQQLAADKALAQRSVLALSDFPLGFTAAPHDNSDSGLPSSAETKFAACSHLPKRFLDDTNDNQPNADSPDFSDGVVGRRPAAQVESNVEIDRSVKDISVPLSYLAAPAVVKCFSPLFHAAFASGLEGDAGVSLSDFSFRGLSVGALGDQSAGFQGRVNVVGARASIPVEFDLYFVRVGRGIVMLSANAFSVPFPQALSQSLLQKMIGRLRSGLAASE